MTRTMTGGCQCGRIRYEARIEGDDAYLCHCTMCRRATGGVSIALRGIAKADVTWTTRAPDSYASSPIARRGFCAGCGTPLTFDYPDSDTMDLTIGSFDDSARFVPRHHSCVESMLPAWAATAHLPGYRTEDNPNTRDRWLKALGKLPG